MDSADGEYRIVRVNACEKCGAKRYALWKLKGTKTCIGVYDSADEAKGVV